MKNEEMETLVDNIKKKIGEDSSSLILDDLSTIITNNQNMNNDNIKKDEEINKLKTNNDNLIKVNANLFQQVGSNIDSNIDSNNDDKSKKDFSLKDYLDKKGNFK